jgi:hypothetical protein
MGFLSNLFGKKREEKASDAAWKHVLRILDDEQLQLQFVSPELRTKLESAPACDKIANGAGPFGLTETNPIPVNGPIGQLAYLSRLETKSGHRLLFHRIGAIGHVDVFEAVSFDGADWSIIFLDLYHPRRSRLSPDGFRITSKVAQFSGFNNYCPDFPYDFSEMKESLEGTGLLMAYIPISQIKEQVAGRIFKRPLAHTAKLELIRARLTSSSVQAPEEKLEEQAEAKQPIFIGKEVAKTNWLLSQNKVQMTASGAVLTTVFLVAAKAGWRHGVLISGDGELLSVSLEPCLISNQDARELGRLLRSMLTAEAVENPSEQVMQFVKLIEMAERGAFSMGPH